MKRIVIGICLVLAIVAWASLISGRAQEAGTRPQQPPISGAPPVNPLQVALLRWYRANTTTSFKVGSQPYGVAFDRANVWVSNIGDAVAKVRASDGKVLGTFAVGPYPGWMAFDGAHIWIPDGKSAVVKLRASDGQNLGTFTVGGGPIAAAFDGANVWVTNTGDGTVSKLRASDGNVLGTFTVRTDPYGVVFDGTDIWVSGFTKAVGLRASDGVTLVEVNTGGSAGIAFDGANIRVGEFNDNLVGKL